MPIPGEREPGSLTTFGPIATTRMRIIPDGSSSLDAATIAERQREGGGAPNQRRAPRGEPETPGVWRGMRRFCARAFDSWRA